MKKTKEEMFQAYKERLTQDRIKKYIRFGTIEYLCYFPQINPYKMAASIVKDGYNVVYDDSAISIKENKTIENKVNKLLHMEVVN